MTAYWVIAAAAFVVLWLAMVWRVCCDASEMGDAAPVALMFIPLFTVGVAMVAAAWPLTLVVGGTYWVSRL